jgi:hypothetical protein
MPQVVFFEQAYQPQIVQHHHLNLLAMELMQPALSLLEKRNQPNVDYNPTSQRTSGAFLFLWGVL